MKQRILRDELDFQLPVKVMKDTLLSWTFRVGDFEIGVSQGRQLFNVERVERNLGIKWGNPTFPTRAGSSSLSFS